MAVGGRLIGGCGNEASGRSLRPVCFSSAICWRVILEKPYLPVASRSREQLSIITVFPSYNGACIVTYSRKRRVLRGETDDY